MWKKTCKTDKAGGGAAHHRNVVSFCSVPQRAESVQNLGLAISALT